MAIQEFTLHFDGYIILLLYEAVHWLTSILAISVPEETFSLEEESTDILMCLVLGNPLLDLVVVLQIFQNHLGFYFDLLLHGDSLFFG